MDAQYLRENINDALIEALASMAVNLPEDGIEYVGKYLLQYVERKQVKEKTLKRYEEIEAKAREHRDAELTREIANAEIRSKEEERINRLQSFIDTLSSLSHSKHEAMSRTVNFLCDYLNIPAAYIAIKRVGAEVESLNYIAASDGQQHCIGNKIIKQPEDAEEPPVRKGLSFDALKLPELPEEEEVEVPEGEEPPPKPVPKPSPLNIDNVVRDDRIKFFGIPKLGALVVIPLSFESVDHENGCTLTYDEDGQPLYNMNKVNTELILSMDTIGKYRCFQPKDVEIAQSVCEKMISTFVSIESKMYEDNVKSLDAIRPLIPPITESMEGLKAAEDEAANEAVGALDEEEKAELGPMKEAISRALYWTQNVINAPIRTATASLKDHVLPPPAVVSSLFFATGCLVGIEPNSMRDPCKDISWDALKQTVLDSLTSDAFNYNPQSESTVQSEASAANIRAYCEATNVFDAAAYPSLYQGCVPISIWLQKNLTARETAISYFKESKNENIEIIA